MAPRPGIRAVLTWVVVVIGAFTVLAAGALAVLTSRMQRIGELTSAAVESVRIGHEVQIDLMLLERAIDPLVRSDIEADVRRRFLHAHDYIATEQEGALLAETQARVEEYVGRIGANGGASGNDEVRDAAYASLGAFLDLNVLESRAASKMAARWDVIADLLAVALVLATLGMGTWIVWWLNTRVIRPLLALTDTVERFGAGERELRGDESGPRELSRMAGRFNRMADALATQRTTQMAHLAGIAHDLRNPLWAVKLALQTVRATAGPDGARSQRGLETAERQVARLERMVEDLLDASNIEAGHLELRPGVHDLAELVRDLGEQFAGSATQHRIDARIPDAALPVVIDPLRIGQVVTNLLTNAIKYSPEGTVVELALRQADDVVVIEVTDQGLGIDASDVSEIFEPFRRVAAGKQRASGTGLGLFVVRRIVEAHGGAITVDSTPGHGSTFCVRLPLGQPHDRPSTVPKTAELPSGV